MELELEIKVALEQMEHHCTNEAVTYNFKMGKIQVCFYKYILIRREITFNELLS